jgi:copper chaperone
MPTFQVPDMTCAHCVKAITAAVKGVDADATLDFDLPAHRVRVEPGAAAAAQGPQRLAQALQAALVEAGYTPALAQS